MSKLVYEAGLKPAAERHMGSSPITHTTGLLMKVYGPYTRKDGRQIVIKIDNGIRKTQSYPRYLMEMYLGRLLSTEEEVDHIDNDYRNNHISNLQLLSTKDNRIKEMNRTHRTLKMFSGTCPICSIVFQKPLNQVKGNLKKGKAGPFCSRSCAGKLSNSD